MGVGVVDAFVGGQIGVVMGGQCGHGLQVVADDLGGDILGYGLLGQSADMLQVEAVFEAIEGLLDAPALVVQFPEAKGREALFVEQVVRTRCSLFGAMWRIRRTRWGWRGHSSARASCLCGARGMTIRSRSPERRNWRTQVKPGSELSTRILQIMPGIDAPGTASLLTEVGGDMRCFGSAERLASWAGICPGNNESAGKRKSGRIRQGNLWLKRLLCEMTQAAARTRCSLKAKFESLSARKGDKKSVVALAHKMLRIIHAMLSKNQPSRCQRQ